MTEERRLVERIRVGSTEFGVGVTLSTVLARIERGYEYAARPATNTPPVDCKCKDGWGDAYEPICIDFVSDGHGVCVKCEHDEACHTATAVRLPGEAMSHVSDERIRNTRAWAAARIGSLSGAEVIVAACDDALAGRALWDFVVDEQIPWSEHQDLFVSMGLLAPVNIPADTPEEQRCANCFGDCEQCFKTTDLLRSAPAGAERQS